MALSLKEQNNKYLWGIIAVNSLFLYAVTQADTVAVNGIRAIFHDTQTLLPVGFAVVITAVLNSFFSSEAKARLVFLRWHDALPGHRAFSYYAHSDSRIDLTELQKGLGIPLPVDPIEQNKLWYKIYKTVEKEPAVSQVHKDFLLLRDYAGLSVLFILVYGVVGLYTITSPKTFGFYLFLLIFQYLVVRQCASNRGVRMVNNVLAIKGSKKTRATKTKG